MLKKNSIGAIAIQAVVILVTVLVVTLVVSAVTSQKKEQSGTGLPRGNSLDPWEPRKKRQIFSPNRLDPFSQGGSRDSEAGAFHCLLMRLCPERPTHLTLKTRSIINFTKKQTFLGDNIPKRGAFKGQADFKDFSWKRTQNL